jgi:hypothetical protein
MISEYLQHTRSIAELDELFDKDKQLAAIAASMFFQHEIKIALSSINEIQQIAQAQILADCQVASATLMSDAEVRSAQLLADAQKAKLKAVMRGYDASYTDKGILEEIEVILSTTSSALSHTAKEAIEKIERTAQQAVEGLKKTAEGAIESISELSEGVQAFVDENKALALKKLKHQKEHTRTPEDVVKDAEEAADKVIVGAKNASIALGDLTKKAIAELKGITDGAVDTINKSSDIAKEKLGVMLSKVLSFLEEDMKL